MSRALPWYKWCPRDFTAETRGWPAVACAIYRELLDIAWDLGSEQLPAAEKELRLLISRDWSAKDWSIAWARCEPKFPLGDSTRRHSPLLEGRRREAIEVADRRSYVASLGGRAARERRQNAGPVRVAPPGANGNGSADGSADGMPSTSTSNNKHLPDSESPVSRKRARPAVPPGPRARTNGVIDENDPEVQRRRALAAQLGTDLPEKGVS